MEDLRKRLSDLEAERDYYRLVAKRLGQKALADAQDFSQMIRDLRQREVKLQQSQEQLEKTIAERTAELVESEARLNFLVKNSSDSLVILNSDGSQRFVSPAAERITGYPIGELEGRTIDTIIHPDDLEEVMAAWNEAVAHPEKTVTVQYRHIHKTRGWVFSEAIAQSFLTEPAINGVIASVRDITERRQVEDSLKEQR